MKQSGSQSGRRRRFGVPLVVGVLLAGGGSLAWQHGRAAQKATEAAAAPTPAAVPVTLARLSPSDVPVTIEGLGTVQAYNTVVVRTRVDGQIEALGFREGQMVRKGDLIAQIDPRPYKATLDQAVAKKAQDESTLANAKADLQRYTKLGAYAASQQVDTQTATVNQQTAQIAADQAAIDNAETQLSYATIRAPITGLAGFRQADVGNIVNASTQTGIVTITQLEPISVVFTAPEEELPAINRAVAAGSVPVSVFQGGGARKLADGVIETVNNTVDAQSGTIKIKATFPNTDHALWPGLSVTTTTLVETLPKVLSIPDAAVQRGSDGLYVFVVDQNGRAHARTVKISHFGDGGDVVSAGLSDGDRVVMAGQYRVADGTLVADREARQADAGTR